jgi:hypothetical protein
MLRPRPKATYSSRDQEVGVAASHPGGPADRRGDSAPATTLYTSADLTRHTPRLNPQRCKVRRASSIEAGTSRGRDMRRTDALEQQFRRGWLEGRRRWAVGLGSATTRAAAADLEELLRRSQDRLRNILPPGGRGNLSSSHWLSVRWWCSGCSTASIRSAGRACSGAGFRRAEGGHLHAGLHFHFWPVETVERCRRACSASSSARTTRSGAPATRRI